MRSTRFPGTLSSQSSVLSISQNSCFGSAVAMGNIHYLWYSLGCLTSESGVQQGDPISPILFSYPCYVNFKGQNLLQQHFHAWYMDVVSSRQSLCQALNLLQAHGPALGLYINLSKYEVLPATTLTCSLLG